MICSHLNTQNYLSSAQGVKIYKDQCTKCFYEPEDKDGLFICLKCLQGQCVNHRQKHTNQHNHPIYLNIRKVLKPE